MAITPDEILERIQNYQKDRNNAFEMVYRHPEGKNDEYYNPFSPVTAGLPVPVLNRNAARTLFDDLIANQIAGRPMNEQQSRIVNLYRPQYVANQECCEATAKEKNRKILGGIIGCLGAAAVLYAGAFLGGIDSEYVDYRFKQLKKTDSSITREDVENQERDSSKRGRNFGLLTGLAGILAGGAILLGKKRRQ